MAGRYWTFFRKCLEFLVGPLPDPNYEQERIRRIQAQLTEAEIVALDYSKAVELAQERLRDKESFQILPPRSFHLQVDLPQQLVDLFKICPHFIARDISRTEVDASKASLLGQKRSFDETVRPFASDLWLIGESAGRHKDVQLLLSAKDGLVYEVSNRFKFGDLSPQNGFPTIFHWIVARQVPMLDDFSDDDYDPGIDPEP